jgi:glycosyltransferase involved in cell wall biosynthesis
MPIRPPRILYVITDLEVGGVPLHLLRLATATRSAGAEVAVVSLKPAGPVGERLREEGIRVFSCAARRAADWRVVARLGGFVADFAPDLVHALLFHANTAARMVVLLGGLPAGRLLCEIQTVEIDQPWHLAVDCWTRRLCRGVIGNSQSVVDHLHRHARILRARLHLMPGGVDLTRFGECRGGAEPAHVAAESAESTESDGPTLIWVGRMDAVKGLDTLIAAFARVRVGRPARLLLVGDGPVREAVEADVARRGLAACVQLLGRRDDVPALLSGADLFVFPSRTEGFPNALLEALAAGVPVVATDVPGCRDLVTDGDTGRLVPVDDPTALARMIERALDDQGTTARMAARARALVHTEYSLARCHARYHALYADVLGDAFTFS